MTAAVLWVWEWSKVYYAVWPAINIHDKHLSMQNADCPLAFISDDFFVQKA